mgnify:CR=1 FL=1
MKRSIIMPIGWMPEGIQSVAQATRFGIHRFIVGVGNPQSPFSNWPCMEYSLDSERPTCALAGKMPVFSSHAIHLDHKPSRSLRFFELACCTGECWEYHVK